MTRRYDYVVQARSGYSLTTDQITACCPAIAADHKHDSRTASYGYVNTLDIINALADTGYRVVKAMQATSRKPGKTAYTKHSLSFMRAEYLGQHMETTPQLLYIGSHDGTSSIEIMTALFRYICSNGLVSVDTTADSYRVRHIGDISWEVVEAVKLVATAAESKLSVVEKMKTIPLLYKEQVDFATHAAIVRWGEGRVEKSKASGVEWKDRMRPSALLQPHRKEDVGDDLWRVLNRIQGNVLGNEWNKAAPGIVKTRQVKSIEGQVEINTALWARAQELRVAHS